VPLLVLLPQPQPQRPLPLPHWYVPATAAPQPPRSSVRSSAPRSSAPHPSDGIRRMSMTRPQVDRPAWHWSHTRTRTRKTNLSQQKEDKKGAHSLGTRTTHAHARAQRVLCCQNQSCRFMKGCVLWYCLYLLQSAAHLQQSCPSQPNPASEITLQYTPPHTHTWAIQCGFKLMRTTRV
jgi:hypothetical protein